MAKFTNAEITLFDDVIHFVKTHCKITDDQYGSLCEMLDLVIQHGEETVLYEHDGTYDSGIDFLYETRRDMELFPLN